MGPTLTLQQTMGRRDPDLTPAHDRVMLWLDEILNSPPASEILFKIDGYPAELQYLDWEAMLDDGRLFIDLLATIRARVPRKGVGREGETQEKRRLIGYEIKPRLYSMGQTLRQLKVYRKALSSYRPGGEYIWDNVVVLVCPKLSDGLRGILVRQGFGYCPIPDEVLLSEDAEPKSSLFEDDR